MKAIPVHMRGDTSHAPAPHRIDRLQREWSPKPLAVNPMSWARYRFCPPPSLPLSDPLSPADPSVLFELTVGDLWSLLKSGSWVWVTWSIRKRICRWVTDNTTLQRESMCISMPKWFNRVNLCNFGGLSNLWPSLCALTQWDVSVRCLKNCCARSEV